MRGLIPLALLSLFGARIPAPQDGTQDAFDVKGYPAAMQQAAGITVKRCSTCHSIERVVGAPHKGAAWKQIVQRMSKKRRARMTREEVRLIAEFLTYHTSPRKRPGRHPPPEGLQGKTDVFPRRRYAVLQTAPVPDMLTPPFDVELENKPCTVKTISRKDVGKPRESVTMKGNYLGKHFTVSLERGAKGYTSAGTQTIHAWTVGPRHFQLVLALWLPPSEEELSELALLVERVPLGR